MGLKNTLSILGMYNWDDNIFENFVVPEVCDRDVIIDNILLECAELELVYPDWETMHFAIGKWSQKELKRWNDIAKVLYAEDYDPFKSYQRSGNYIDLTTRDLTYTTDGTNTNSTSAWNETDYTNREKTNVDSDYTDKGTIKLEHTEDYSGIPSSTTKQKIAQDEIDLRLKNELDDIIINSFKRRFCLMVY